MLSARKEAGKFRGRHPVQVDGSAVPRRAAQPVPGAGETEPEEKAERFQLMQQHGISELDAAFRVAEKIDRAGHRTAGAGHAGLTGATRCACLHSPAVILGSVC
jgi:hypothetical protein